MQALSAGAKAIYPVGSIEEALRLARTFGRDEVLLCGERKCLPIEGFDLGNSPSEFVPEKVARKILVMTTTNGTAALSLRLSELTVMKNESGEWPLLMLDDVMSELDPARRRQLVKYLTGVQTMITCTDPEDLAGAEIGAMFRVEKATIRKE